MHATTACRWWRTAPSTCSLAALLPLPPPAVTMDLHGMHVAEALEVLEHQVEALSKLIFPEGMILKVRRGH